MNEQNSKFEFTYSASEQEEINQIRKKYLPDDTPKEVDKMTQLRQLDACVTKKAMTVSITIGVIGTLLLGMGMSLIMTDIGDYIGITSKIIPAVIIGFIGMVGIISAYPLYNLVIARQRKKIAPIILKLTDELSKK